MEEEFDVEEEVDDEDEDGTINDIDEDI